MKGVDGEIEDKSIETYTSPRARDKEGDKVIMTFEGLTNAIKATQNQDDTFTIRVDKSLLDKKTQKNLIKIRIKDSNNRENWRTF